jgi:hypothetical protein
VRSIGFISKQMYRMQDLTIRSAADLKVYKLPLDKIEVFDIEREVFLNDGGEVVLETPKHKVERSKFIYKTEKIDNKPIINLDTNLGGYDAKNRVK